MHNSIRLFCAIVLSVISVSQACAGTLPSRQAPQNYKTYDDATGARIVVGSPGQFSSPKQAFLAGRGQFKGYFDPTPRIVKAIQNKQRNVAILAFSGSIQRDKIVGLVLVKCPQSGDSRLDIAYGEPKVFLPHVKALLTKMNTLDAQASGSLKKSSGSKPAASGPSGLQISKYAAASKKVSLTKTTSPDGTLTIGVASGFQPSTFNMSECVIQSNDGAFLKYDFVIVAVDPRSGLARSLGRSSAGGVRAMYNPDPITAWKNINSAGAQASGQPDPDIHVAASAPMHVEGTKASASEGTYTFNGIHYVYSNMVGLMAPNQMGMWNVTITILAAPADKVSTDAPKLVAMLRSAHFNKQAQARANRLGYQQLMANQRILEAQSAAQERAIFGSGSSAAATYNSETANMMDSTDRSTAGLCNLLRDQEVVTDSEGEHGTVSNGLGDLLTNADPNEFSEVPLSDYQQGVDY
jgi:hypothetical protein